MQFLTRMSLMFVLLLAGSALAADGAAKTAQSADKLLKGVVHFTDDDVRFRTAGGITIFVDPMSSSGKTLVKQSGMIKPDLVLITHSHPDHYRLTILRECVRNNPKVLLAAPAEVLKQLAQTNIKCATQEVAPGKSYTLAGIKVQAVPAYFKDPQAGHPKANQWVGYVLNIDGASYYVTGDTEPLPEMANLKVDVLFPLLSGCGGNMPQALKVAELTKAPLVVPVHWSEQVPTAEKFRASLPKGVRGAYYVNGKLIAKP